MKYIYSIVFLLLMAFTISYAQPGNGFTCQEAACLSENLGVTLNNGGSPPTPPLSFSCGVTHNNLFYSFCPETGPVTLNITPANCTTGQGVQAIIYQTDDCANFNELVCISNGNTNPFSINFTGTPCETYILMIDGFSGDVCDFTVTGTGIAAITGPPLEPILDPSDDPIVMCEGEQLDIEITNGGQCCTANFWEVQSGLGFISLDVNGTSATINAIAEGIATFCVKADNFCYESELCVDVEVVPPPQIEPIAPTITCDQFVDFCDYLFFFDPPIEPDPFSEGWDVSFFRSQFDCNQNNNAIACPYDLSGQTSHLLYMRVARGNNCFSCVPFELIYQKPEMDDIFVEPICGSEDTEVDLTEVIMPRDLNGLTYERVSYHETEQDARDDFAPIIPPVLDEPGVYLIWVRAETDFGCFDVKPVEIEIIATPQIEIEQPGPICFTDDFEFDLADLFCQELTGYYACDDLDLRFYEDPPTPQDLDFYINPKSIVYDPGCYWAVAMLERGGTGEPRYCASDTFRVCLDTVSAPEVELDVIPPPCPEDVTEIIFNFMGQGPFDVEYEIRNQDGSFVDGDFFATADDEVQWIELIDINPLDVNGDSLCVFVIEFEGPVLTEDECEPIIGDPICFEYPGDGTLTLGVDQSICIGESADLTFSYSGSDSLTVTYSDGTNNFTINDLRDGHIETVSPDSTTQYFLVDATNPSGCPVILEGEPIITVNNPPEFQVLLPIDCNGAQQYQATIVISGGEPGTYTIDGTLVQNPSDTFVTIWYPNNSLNTLLLDDANGCGPVPIDLQKNCTCPNESGTMQSDLIEVCIGEIAIGTHNMDSLTFMGDNFYFALHTGSGPSLGTVFNTSANPQFAFDAGLGMMTGTRYYISAVSGNDDGAGGIDLQDSCTQVSIGQPVIWYDLPTASLDGESTVCAGERVSIPVTFTGQLPFTAVVDTNGILYDTITFNNINATLPITPQSSQTTVTISYIIDGVGCEGTGIDDYVINVSPAPEATFTTQCDNTNTTYTATITLTSGTGNYLINGNPVTNPFVTPPIPSGETREFIIDDDLGCGVDTLFITRDCDCETDPGQIENTDLSLCIDETGNITELIPPTLDGNDVAGYIIFVNQARPFQTKIAFFTTTIIDFNMTLDPGAMFNVGQTYFIAPVAGDDDGMGFIDFANDDCARIGNIIELVFNPLPTVDFSGAQDFCIWDEIDLDLEFTGTPPYSVNYTINGGNTLNLVSNSNNDVITVQGGAPNFTPGLYDFEIIDVTDANGCTSSSGLVQSVMVMDTLYVSPEIAVCDATQENYRVSFTISGGSGNYFVDPPNDPTGPNYVSPWRDANLTSYRYRVYDQNGCDEDIIEGMHDCDCPNPGIVDEDPLVLCEDEVARVSLPPNTGVQLFLLDTLEYILHSSSTDNRGTIFLRSPDGSFTFDPNVLDYGVTYYISRMVGDDDGTGQVDLTDDCSEVVSPGQPVTWYQNPEAIMDNADELTLNCDNLSYTLLGGNSTPSGNVDIKWIDVARGDTIDGASLVVQNPGMYILWANTLNSPCFDTDTVNVLQDDDLPTAFVAEPDVLDCNNPSITLDATSSDFGTDFSYSWTLPGGAVISVDSQTLDINTPGDYTLRVENTTNNCAQSYTVTVDENFVFPSVNPGLGGMFDCHTDSITLAGSVSTESGQFDVQWFVDGVPINGANTLDLIIFDGGWYALEARDPINGCVAKDSVFVSADENIPNDALVQAFDPQCHDEENGYINVDSVSGGRTPYEYSVNGGPFTLTPTFFNLGAGEYDVTVRDQNGCTWSTTVTIDNPPPIEADLGGDTTIVWGDTISLIGNISNIQLEGEGQYNIDTITISYVDNVSCTNCPNPTADVSPLTPTVYTLTVVTTNGCVATANRRINVEVLRPFFVPNSFSPNGDGVNDFLTLHMNNLDFIEAITDFQLYDRWGEQVFTAPTIVPATQVELWDGVFNGEPLNPQVLVYSVEVLFKDGVKEQYKGDVTLFR